MQKKKLAVDKSQIIEPAGSLKERNIIYLVNPIAGNRNKDKFTKSIREYSAEKKLGWEIMETSKDGDYYFLKEKIKREKITDVIIVGGDGSVNNIIAALRQENVCFGIIPYGSGNGLARAVGIPMNIKQAFDIIAKGESVYCDSFLINKKSFGCMLMGLGFDAKIAHDFASSSSRGLKTYIQKVISNFFNAKTYKFDIYTEDFHFSTDAFFISIANGNQFGNNFTIAPKASVNDGLLDIVVVQKMGKFKLISSVIKQITGNNELQDFVSKASSEDIFYLQKPTIKIKNSSHAPVHVDGEPLETVDEFEVEIVKNSFRLLQ